MVGGPGSAFGYYIPNVPSSKDSAPTNCSSYGSVYNRRFPHRYYYNSNSNASSAFRVPTKRQRTISPNEQAANTLTLLMRNLGKMREGMRRRRRKRRKR